MTFIKFMLTIQVAVGQTKIPAAHKNLEVEHCATEPFRHAEFTGPIVDGFDLAEDKSYNRKRSSTMHKKDLQ